MNRHNQNPGINAIINILAVALSLVIFYGIIWPAIDSALADRDEYNRQQVNKILSQGVTK